MKGLTKLTLASAIAAASFSTNAMQALDDATLSDVTGQSGVTIELNFASGIGDDAAATVGKVTYTDEGQVQINNIQVGSNEANFKITQTIDVESDGKLVMGVDAVDGLNVQVESVHLAAAPVGAGNAIGAVVGDSLVSDVNLNIDLGATTTTIGANSLFTRPDTTVGAAPGATIANAVDNNAGQGVTDSTIVIKSEASVELTPSSADALGGQVKLREITFNDGGTGNKASINQTIYASNGGLNIIIDSIEGDLNIGRIELGNNNQSIGSIAVSDISLSGVTQRIYGHAAAVAP